MNTRHVSSNLALTLQSNALVYQEGVSQLKETAQRTLHPGLHMLASSIGIEESSVHRLKAGRACEGAHQPIIDALSVVGVHTGQVTHAVTH